MQHPQMFMQNLTIFKFEPATPNMLAATRCNMVVKLNERNMLRPKMLRYVALKRCDRLAGASHVSLHVPSSTAELLETSARVTLSHSCPPIATFSLILSSTESL